MVRPLLLSLASLVAALLVACTFSTQRQGGVRVASNVPDAVLYVDEELRGPARVFERRYVHLDPGVHRLVLEHPDHFTEYAEVDVRSNTAMQVRFEMRRRPE
jgi:hypothetical protein